MKRLILLRHGKAEEWGPTDFERRLHERGIRQSLQRGIDFRLKSWLPDLILSSDAQRTKETTMQLLQGLEFTENNVQWNHALYNASSNTILHEIMQVSDDVNELVVVGHNNGLSEVVSFFYGDYAALKTSGYARFEFNTGSWSDMLTAPIISRLVQQESA